MCMATLTLGLEEIPRVTATPSLNFSSFFLEARQSYTWELVDFILPYPWEKTNICNGFHSDNVISTLSDTEDSTCHQLPLSLPEYLGTPISYPHMFSPTFPVSKKSWNFEFSRLFMQLFPGNSLTTSIRCGIFSLAGQTKVFLAWVIWTTNRAVSPWCWDNQLS